MGDKSHSAGCFAEMPGTDAVRVLLVAVLLAMATCPLGAEALSQTLPLVGTKGGEMEWPHSSGETAKELVRGIIEKRKKVPSSVILKDFGNGKEPQPFEHDEGTLQNSSRIPAKNSADPQAGSDVSRRPRGGEDSLARPDRVSSVSLSASAEESPAVEVDDAVEIPVRAGQKVAPSGRGVGDKVRARGREQKTAGRCQVSYRPTSSVFPLLLLLLIAIAAPRYLRTRPDSL